MSAGEKDMDRFNRFVHRTFNETDCTYYISLPRNIYKNYPSMEDVLLEGMESGV